MNEVNEASPASNAGDLERLVSWHDCSHHFVFSFGPVKTCQHCGATTIATVDPGESKPIHAPVGVYDS